MSSDEFNYFNTFAWVQDIEREFDGQSDRGMAIVGASFLDEMLKSVLQAFLINEERMTSRLFDPYKQLSPFSAKIHMAYCLGLISSTEHKNLETIRSIRNDFAHKLGDISFQNQSIRDKCTNLEIPDGMYVPSEIPLPLDGKKVELDLTPPGPNQPDALFKATVSYLMHSLVWRWVEATKRRSIKAKELHSATEVTRMMLAEFDRLEERVNLLEERLDTVREKMGEVPEEDKATRELDPVGLFKKVRPLMELSVQIMEDAYERKSKDKTVI